MVILHLLFITCNYVANIHQLGTATKFEVILHQCYEQLIQYMDINELLPFLIREQLVTTHESEVLTNPYETRKEKNLYLLSKLPTKGENAFELFLKCLEESNEHLGHAELVVLLKQIASTTTLV